MIYDRDEERRRSALRKAQAETARLQAKLAGLRRNERSARSRLLSGTRHETWHAHRLAYQDRQAGYSGEMAEARYYLRALPADQYVQAILPYADQLSDGGVVDIEVLAVRANMEDWTQKGQALLHERARERYEEECRLFATWTADNPGKKSWRDRPATRAQWMLIRRTVDALDLASVPSRISCGEAHDWLQEHGANVRFRAVDNEGDHPREDVGDDAGSSS